MGWLAETRWSYDSVAEGYTAFVREAIDGAPYVRAVLAMFAELVRGRGPVLDVGCGPGQLTGELRERGVQAYGIDLSLAMVRLASGDGPRFAVGSMTTLPVRDVSLAGLMAWYSVIHVPDDELPAVFGQFRRVLRPGGVALLGFHAGDGVRHKTQGYGGHPMNVQVHRRPVERVAGWLADAGFVIEARMLQDPDAETPAGMVFGRRPGP